MSFSSLVATIFYFPTEVQRLNIGLAISEYTSPPCITF